ncbi:hypothetical protein K443DRAFT_13628 [Laccaria amethystina LaAM-08-1]|uniref:Uncharacterized protein n=1 Tax=Laccaria amethystina LaAM-08-1 TaxID=1095629 RepID=A0A0C9WI62_9AGAR|nr:hypothetical protein K443DRAFT_13628 [Laccaria amethystina LaAM-08-1]
MIKGAGDVLSVAGDVHVRAPFHLIREAAPYFPLKPELRENRSIINVAKAAILGLTKTVPKECPNAIVFGLIHTR